LISLHIWDLESGGWVILKDTGMISIAIMPTSEANTPGKGVLDGKARVVKRGRGGGKSSNLSTLGSPPLRRRGSRMRKPPDGFQ
jgi:hypothetical protein